MAPIPSTMKAVQINKNGGVDVLEHVDIPVPKPAANHILIRNEYAGINYIDTYFRTGLYPAPKFPLTLGREAAGEVISCGADASPSFAAGTKVVYMDTGAYAEYAAIPAEKVIAVPEGVSTETAAAAVLQGLTAWTLIRESANVQKGQWTLVHAAAGGVGSLLVQLLRGVGAKVIATASTDEKLQLAKKYGADYTVNSGDDVVAKVKEITSGHGVDAIFDGVGKDTFDADLEMIALKGNLISFGNASGAVPPVSILKLGPKNVRLMRPVLFGYVSTRDELEKYAAELFDFIRSGKLEIAIHEVYPLKEAGRAHTDIESRKTKGKLLLKL
ncbi:hypothetical protein K4F52_001715 [Lecanicillium sp. MT-2017a]|nr:hypothetical protein K4F52_001715 [Lecanicillium sp. MT-2017a]